MAPRRDPLSTSKAGRKARPSLILASTSPRRRSLLAEHGYIFEVIAPEGVQEIAPAYLSPGETVLANARAKARAISFPNHRALVIGVDTEVFFNGHVLGKPADLPGAVAMLSSLNGKTHEVYSGVWLEGPRCGRAFIEVTRVHFHQRTSEELQRYLSRIGPLDKAGAYSAQEDHGEMIARVEGSYSNVIGLPMERLIEELRAEGIVPESAA